jgi:hypothetical protein
MLDTCEWQTRLCDWQKLIVRTFCWSSSSLAEFCPGAWREVDLTYSRCKQANKARRYRANHCNIEVDSHGMLDK